MELEDIKKLDFYQITELLENYDKDNYALVLADYPTRDEDYKYSLFLWFLDVKTELLDDEHYYEIIGFMLQNGTDRADLFVREVNNYPIHNNDERLLNLFIDYGIDINEALRIASMHNFINLVDILLQRGADINVDNDVLLYEAVYREAINSNFLDLVKYLLEHGANPKAQHSGGYTALHNASYSPNIEVPELLLQYGAKLHSKNDLALFIASNRDNYNVVNFFLDSDEPESFIGIERFKPELQDEIIRRVEQKALKEDKTPLELAGNYTNLGLVNLLKERHQ